MFTIPPLPLPFLLTILAPVHILLFSTLLGTQLYQSFVLTRLAFLALPGPAFRTLQKRVFRVYFRLQAVLLVLTALTLPAPGGAFVGLIKHKSDWIPFVVAGMTAGLNMLVYGPRTERRMVERVHQETRDKNAAEADDDAEEGIVSPDMHRLNRSFRMNHAMTIHFNVITIGAMVWYGVRLGGRLSV